MLSLKQRLSEPEIVQMPGVYDALTAALAEKAGFEAAFISGSAVAYSQLGRPDIGLVTMTEMANVVDRVRDRVGIPLFVDADSGFGNNYNVERAVRLFERSGASGIQIEDQVNTKSVAEVSKRPLVPIDTMVGKLKSALDARTSEETIISARSDAVFTEGVDAALERANAYADNGVDMVFVEGLTGAEDRQRLCDMLEGRVTLLFNLLKPGAAGAPSPADLQALGYDIVLFPAAVIGPSANAAWQSLNRLKGTDISTDPVPVTDLIDADVMAK
ncbi:MAG: isocitrate lyase/PEP mutase family protein [Rhodospirillaceae bacterium]|nr:isocitrate lyase/PEP mutase family protein [Rhodospirillaceae bacterium]